MLFFLPLLSGLPFDLLVWTSAKKYQPTITATTTKTIDEYRLGFLKTDFVSLAGCEGLDSGDVSDIGIQAPFRVNASVHSKS